jgi:hypothetical protein
MKLTALTNSTLAERIVCWELEAYRNDMGNLTDELGGQQFRSVLSITMRKLKVRRRATGGFRVIDDEDMSN